MSAPLPAPVPVVCAIIQHEGSVLIAQRPEGKKLAGLWEFPGGKVEAGESPVAALHREIMEELGCSLADLQAGPSVLHDYEWGQICLHPFLCTIAPGSTLPHANEHAALTWAHAKNLHAYDLAPADLPVVKWLKSILVSE